MDQDRSRNTTVTIDPVSLDSKGARATEDSSFALLRTNIIEAVRILILRRWVFFIPFCLVTCGGAITSHWVKRTYESSTVIERRDHPVLMNLRQTAATGGFARFFRPTLVSDLTSVETMSDVVRRVGLADGLELDENGDLTEEGANRCKAVAAGLVGGTRVRIVQKSDHFDQIRISYSCDEPGLPYRVVDGLKHAYVRSTREKLTELLNEGKTYFEKIAAERRQKANALEEDLLKFQAEFIGIDPTNPGALKLKLTSLETERDELIREIDTLTREVATRTQMLEAYQRKLEFARSQRVAKTDDIMDVPSITKSAEAQAIETEIRRLMGEIHEMQLARRMTERHPDIAERRTRIARLRENLKAQYLADAEAIPANRGISIDDATARSVVEAAVGFDVELAGLQMGLQDRAARLDAATSRIQIVEQDLAKHKALEANVFRYRKEYTLKSELLAQAQDEYNVNTRRALDIASILEADESERGISFSVIAPPTRSNSPVSPRGMTVLVFALLAGVAAGSVAVLLRELFDQTYHTTKQVTRSLGLALLESIDEIVTSADRAKRFRRRVLYAPTAFLILVSCVSVACAAAYLSLEQPRTFHRVMERPLEIWNNFSSKSGVAEADTKPDATESAEAVSPDHPSQQQEEPDPAVLAANDETPDRGHIARK